ncbi:hypothetical protein F477_03564 [Pseudomonas sp. URIL14HWK12:I3]|jgi:hypothetical protein|nr:hypothetical protein AL527_10060 [Pseudomonas fulva]PZW52718.1 hypothetical protein F478_02513 [Pseudomonas sp. URIL14HWK12:I2]PZW53463.1 hypothetical protein F477_03564 [Pseudomonas sp. URIL14HWK12:I3]TFA87402.1 hypothetical protein F473_04025 [Pseudomonas sp. URIL14HWK12:I1]CRN08471.1 hypothetical protein PYEL_43330 [Pseudomonas sp. URMO17WK12:I11]SNB83298.1 hypothetical protein SAMN02746026_04053 [Pseudomonas sp. LAIL14HWK12:I4]HAL66420.1 hypothetical protein [Pseudomonas sp.]
MPAFLARLFKRTDKPGHAELNRSTDSSQISPPSSVPFMDNDETTRLTTTCSIRSYDVSAPAITRCN